MKKFAIPALLALAFVIQLSLPLATVIEKESTENSGLLVRIPVSLYDPFDPFRGRYLNLRLELKVSSLSSDAKYGVFDAVTPDSWTLRAEAAPPADNPYYLELSRANEESADYAVTPLRYYVQEDLAIWADSHLRDLFQDDSHSFLLEGRVFRGEFRPGELLIDGKTLASFVGDNTDSR